MITWLNAHTPFPPVEQALGVESGASGLLAASRDLSLERLLSAYRLGIFPWYSEDQPVLWWSPDPRMILAPDAFKISVSLRKTLRRVLRDPDWEIRVDNSFAAVIQACANAGRRGQDGTWVTADIIGAYGAMHLAGHAHSVEAWYRNTLVGGLYAIGIGSMIYGESMFAQRTDASKIALAALVGHARRHRVEMIDCQQNTSHLSSLGGREIPRTAFLGHLRHAIAEAPISWHFDKSALQDALV